MPTNSDLRVAVITGRHPYDIVNFSQLLRSLEGIDAYTQSLEEFAVEFTKENLGQYDAFVFFNYHRDPLPDDEQAPWHEGRKRAALEHIANTEQGLVFLHHGLLCWPDNPRWDELIGMKHRDSFEVKFGQTLNVSVLNRDHPITAGLSNWVMIDETYSLGAPDETVDLLLATDHPLSMPYLAWTKQKDEKRIFNLQSGHDAQTWRNPNFKTVLERGIHWSANRS